MRHLFPSVARVWRNQPTGEDGAIGSEYLPVPGLEWVEGRLDLFFIRPGKDLPPPLQAGATTDRVGIWFQSPEYEILPSDILEMIPGYDDELPVQGTFEVKQVPDVAIGYAAPHHIEVQVQEVRVRLRFLEHSTPLDPGAPV